MLIRVQGKPEIFPVLIFSVMELILFCQKHVSYGFLGILVSKVREFILGNNVHKI